MRRSHYETLIVGGGPAGLSIANALVQKGDYDFCLIDSGKPLTQRDRHTPGGISTGLGGAGLFSDGKFSFFPSASKLWQLPDKDSLDKAYQWLTKLFAPYNINVPPIDLNHIIPFKQRSGCLKYYPSFYLSLDARYHLINCLTQAFQDKIQFNTSLKDIIQMADGTYKVITNKDTFYCNTLCWASGKMSPLVMQELSINLPHQFRRVEVGVRIQGHYQHPFFHELLAEKNTLDPKYIFIDDVAAVSWRTFCFCQRGEIVNSGTEDNIMFSGRSDCEPTDLSNIGFNTRIESTLSGVKHLPKLPGSFTFCLKDFFAKPDILEQYFPRDYAVYIAKGFMELANRFPCLQQASHELEIIGPTIEGVGFYPCVDGQLKIDGHSIYVAGDAVGSFRGITAAMLSGYYIGEHITNSRYATRRSNEYLQFA
jgi:uncharacterized FAD-dependent dehydrogenase